MAQVYEIPPNDVLSRQPGFVAPDYIVLVRLQAFIEALRKNPEALDQALASYDESFVQQYKQVLVRPQRPLPVYEGYPVGPEMLPGIGVRVRGATEMADRQVVGNVVGEMVVGTALEEIYGTWWQASVSIMCFGTNQREANALGRAVVMAIKLMGEELEDIDGLQEMVLSMEDPKPVEDDVLPRIQNVFSRIVSLSCTYLDTWAKRYSPLMSGTEGGATNDWRYPAQG